MKIGIDWGGTKIEGIAIDPKNGKELNVMTKVKKLKNLLKY